MATTEIIDPEDIEIDPLAGTGLFVNNIEVCEEVVTNG
jgi:hypothetical protein